MLRAAAVVRREDFDGRSTVGTITLDRAGRYRRRVVLTSDGGLAFLLDLAEPTYLTDGEALLLDDGRLILVRAANEELLEIHATNASSLARIAWHIGNRHTPAEITPHAIYIQPDHVLAAMIEGLGGHVHHVRRPFEPEGGAYGSKGPLIAGHHHHDHHHDDA